ncbi:winged helix-turn-helix transcriptional regulator [Photobacterium sp. GJ3]|uniref:MarR family winged helix-turn-helix transcriptional regulator n=1 Tax=Photobacterium sp. GJ3 TaxID=2829502 RepID=UPI001B8B6A4F|nr:MarR family winged helix-turn-helix transcriptional regulator [Photobacterium sp. GJ3]QUJ66842.1 winged helix-turn-helix transcriptional regulator [Photobacterium sp. GJ3]
MNISKDRLVTAILLKHTETFEFYRNYSLEKRTYGTDAELFSFEADIISAIADNDDITISDLAIICNKTKSAISQTISKLEKLQLVCKVPAQNDKRKQNLSLTEQGVIVDQYHKQIDNLIESDLSDLLSKLNIKDLNMTLALMENILQVSKNRMTK